MRWLLILFITIPIWLIIYLLFHLGNLNDLSFIGIWDSSVYTFQQSLFSSFFSVFFGVFGAIGLLGFSGVKRKVLEAISILPTVFPTLFLILACLNFIELIMEFPYGIYGIIILHSFINIGFASVLIARTVEDKLGLSIIWSWLSGIPRKNILFDGVFKALKWDLARIFFVIFLFSWCSFTVPYLVGNIKHSTLEVLLFEQIKIHVNWSQAVFIALIQLMMIWLLGALFLKKDVYSKSKISRSLDFLSIKGFVVIPVLIVFAIFWGSLQPLLNGAQELWSDSILQLAVYKAALVSLGLGLLTSFIMFIFCCLILWCWSHAIRRFFIIYQSPSALILGFIFVYYFGNNQWPLLITAFCIAFIYLPFIYKLTLDSKFLSLNSNIKVAELLGANHFLMFSKIKFPLAITVISLASSIAGFWAVGDYALSALFLTTNVSLPIFIERLISTYRFELASSLIWINLFVGIIVFLIPLGAGYVYSKKYQY